MVEKIIIDTNVIARALLKDNATQTKQSVELLKRIEANEVIGILTSEVIAELFFVMGSVKLYGLSKEQITSLLRVIINLKSIETTATKQTILLAFDICVNENLAIVDSLLVAKSLKEGIELRTYDKRMLKVLDKLKTA